MAPRRSEGGWHDLDPARLARWGFLAIGRATGDVVVYNTATYREVLRAKLARTVRQVDFDPSSRDVVIVSDAGAVIARALDGRRTLAWRDLPELGARDVAKDRIDEIRRETFSTKWKSDRGAATYRTRETRRQAWQRGSRFAVIDGLRGWKCRTLQLGEVVGSDSAFLRRARGCACYGRGVSIIEAFRSSGRSIDLEPIRPILARVIERWHPLQIWLFGSRARGENRPDSDWDLLAVVPDCPEPADFDDPMTVWRVKRQPGISSDLIVYRASDFDEDLSVPNTLAYSTSVDGVLVYER